MHTVLSDMFCLTFNRPDERYIRLVFARPPFHTPIRYLKSSRQDTI